MENIFTVLLFGMAFGVGARIGSGVMGALNSFFNISIDYLASICAQVEERMKNISTPVVFFDTDKLNFLDKEVVEKTVLPIINSFIQVEC